MKIHSIENKKVFIPKFMGNRELPEEEQIKVHIKSFPPAVSLGTYRNVSRGANGYTISYPKDTELMVSYVGKIEGVEVPVGMPNIFDGRTLALSDIRELVDLVAEIRGYLLDGEEDLTQGEA